MKGVVSIFLLLITSIGGIYLLINFISSFIIRYSDNVYKDKLMGDQEQRRDEENGKKMIAKIENLNIEEISLENGLKGRIYTQKNDCIDDNKLNDKVVILLTSLDANIEYASQIAATYTHFGATLVGIDYHGFGKSSDIKDTPQEKDMYKDAQEIFNYAKNRYPNKEIIIHCYSLGCFLGVKIAQNNKIKKLVLHNPVKSGINLSEIEIKNCKEFPPILLHFLLIPSKVYAPCFILEPEIKKIPKENLETAIFIGSEESEKYEIQETNLLEIIKKEGFNYNACIKKSSSNFSVFSKEIALKVKDLLAKTK